jgi:hypothetical protein
VHAVSNGGLVVVTLDRWTGVEQVCGGSGCVVLDRGRMPPAR